MRKHYTGNKAVDMWNELNEVVVNNASNKKFKSRDVEITVLLQRFDVNPPAVYEHQCGGFWNLARCSLLPGSKGE